MFTNIKFTAKSQRNIYYVCFSQKHAKKFGIDKTEISPSKRTLAVLYVLSRLTGLSGGHKRHYDRYVFSLKCALFR